MFSRFARIPLRRCLHTSSGLAGHSYGSLRRATKIGFAATAATTVFIAWQLTQAQNQISMDSPQAMISTTEHPAPAKSTQRTKAPSESPSPAATPETDVFVPDAPSAPGGDSEATSEPEAPEGDGEPSPGDAPASGGAFNPETGEINWDCPCLGGMAHGPCGPEFREAFSCFVFSEDEPKGINCVDKFQNMQNCFRAHPEVYADEIMDDDDDDAPSTTDDSGDVPPENASNSKLDGDAQTTPETTQLDSTPVANNS
ncbi:hypothetical protein HYPSUDRAFT_155294 [Hypholoma sublateritium FD-334 SS-4]|uniref:Mitochondrial intermembrane space import and assembly protein 40 n=1 Tax=Hypholoma sublateritium (strain FD-334 SS-4) TaxID=945553 RepID=A0A0D2PKZ8_HYPSF|nr:hypothetical protein HYPSUDRAFT_155294 [Hypholoma sublateritium FD-334 SS-4]